LAIRASQIAGNRASRGGGIFIGDGDAVIEFKTVSGNQSGSDGGGIHHEGRELLSRENCIDIDTRAGGVGGGVSASSALKLLDSTVAGNTASAGGGISGGSKLLKIEGSTIERNVATAAAGFGGGINVGRGGLAFGDSTVEDNQGLLGAGIFSAFSSGDVKLTASTVAGNVAAADGGGIWNQSAEIDLNGSKVIANTAGERGGGMFVGVPEPEVRLRNGSIVSDNQPDQCFPATLKC
jgi:hypothetical protein